MGLLPGKLRVALVALALLILEATWADAAWLQAGYDAARTGATPDAGPVTDDVAWTLGLPGSRAGAVPPILVGRQIYALTSDQGLGPHLTTNGLFRVGLDDAQAELVLSLDRPPISFASDGERAFILDDDGVSAYALAGGPPIWRFTFPRLVTNHWFTQAWAPAVADGVLYLALTEVARTAEQALGQPCCVTLPEARVFVVALDGADGTPRWMWVKDIIDETGFLGARLDRGEGPSASHLSAVVGFAVIQPVVLVLTFDLLGGNGPFGLHAWALGEHDGQARWHLNSTLEPQRTLAVLLGEENIRAAGGPTGTSNLIYLMLPDLMAVNPAYGNEVWRSAVRPEDVASTIDGGGLALAGDSLYAASVSTLSRFDTVRRELVWRQALEPGSNEYWSRNPLVLAGDTLFAKTITGPESGFDFDGQTIYALGADDGKVAWRREFRDSLNTNSSTIQFAVGGEVMVVANVDGTLAVLGRTAASLQPLPQASSLRPAPGETVRVDLSATAPGVHGPATMFRADWGDGNASEWQPSPWLTHGYDAVGAYTARLSAGNAAGQTASVELLFDIGAPLSSAAVVAESATAIEPSAAPAPTRPSSPGGLEALVVLLGVSVLAVGALGLRSARKRRQAPAEFTTGSLFLGRYRVGRKLGAGGSGDTYLCRDERIGRNVVIKSIASPGRAGDALEAVQREARAIGAVRHPNVVALYDVELRSGQAFIVMEHLEGGSLRDRLARGPLTMAEFRQVGLDTLAALAAVHAVGLVHRDVKPSNLLLTKSGATKLGDFGIAHIAGFETTAGAVRDGSTAVGTIRYMSPEQAKGKRVTAASDLFSAAATLYEAYTGNAFLEAAPGESAVELQMRAAGAGPFARPVKGPPTLRAWFARALEPAPERRFASAAAMRASLRAALDGSVGEHQQRAADADDVAGA